MPEIIFKYKKKLVPDIMKAYDKLASENDIIVIEGAGSPARDQSENRRYRKYGNGKDGKGTGASGGRY